MSMDSITGRCCGSRPQKVKRVFILGEPKRQMGSKGIPAQTYSELNRLSRPMVRLSVPKYNNVAMNIIKINFAINNNIPIKLQL